MTALRTHPHLLEVNARLWLARLRARCGHAMTLATVPEAILRALARQYDLLWLMGAWRRSPAARQEALGNTGLRSAYDAALPDWNATDVDGSPYAVFGYELDPALGEAAELATFRRRLADAGVGLIVDFVANHLAKDHPFTRSHPQWFVRGDESRARAHPNHYYRTADGHWLAHGRDPYFPPWTDTAQVNFFSPGLRQALTEELLAIAQVADGARCDMAMLGLSEVVARLWGDAVAGERPPRGEFWSEIIAAVKARHPQFLFIAEAYWGTEPQLLELGFDYAYDKQFYDQLLASSAHEIRERLAAAGPLLCRGVRFVENHDEQRAMTAFGPSRARAAALAVMTLPGMRMVHDGQSQGRRIRVPVQLVREPDEATETATEAFYDDLLAVTSAPIFHDGSWGLVPVEPHRAGDDDHRALVAWSWTRAGEHRIIALNPSDAPARGRLSFSGPEPPTGAHVWHELLAGQPGVASRGAELVLGLDPWSARAFAGSRQQG